MSLSDLINVSISVTQARTLGTGFGVPLILSESPTWVERTRSYSSATGVAADFAVTTPEYRAASAFFAQTPSVPIVKIGRGTNKPTQQYTFTPVYADNTTYVSSILDTAGVSHQVSVTTGTTNLNTLIGQLKTAYDALSLAITTANVGGATFTITANVAGAYFGVSVADINKIGNGQTNVDVNTTADLTAIALADPAWYGLITIFQSPAIIEAAATWTLANSRLYIAASCDSVIATTASPGSDVASVVAATANQRAAILFHNIPGEFADAAWMGACFPLISGSETWAYKTLAGVTVDPMNETWYTNILAKNANLYDQIGNANITEQGKTSSGQFIDVTRFVDWLSAQIATNVFNVITQAGKDPYTDPGFANIRAAILAALKQGVTVGGLTPNSISCTVPLAATMSSTDRANRNISGVTFGGQIAGAVQTAKTLAGTLTT